MRITYEVALLHHVHKSVVIIVYTDSGVIILTAFSIIGELKIKVSSHSDTAVVKY